MTHAPLLFPAMCCIHRLRTLGPLLMTTAQRAVPCWTLKGSPLCPIHLDSQSQALPSTPTDVWAILSCGHLLNCPCATKSLPACLEPRTLFPSDFSKAWPGAEQPGTSLSPSLLSRLFFPLCRRPLGLEAPELSTIFEDLTALHRSTSHGPAPGNLL